MTDFFANSMSAAASGMRAQGHRMRVISENIANADTPGFHRKTIAFDDVFDAASGASHVKVTGLAKDSSPLQVIHDPSNPLANENGDVEMSNVNMLLEIADSREANRSYQANLSMFQQAREMYSSLLQILKR